VVATLLRLLHSFPSALGPGVTRVDSLAQLADGLTLFHFLHSLEPTLFDPEPLQRPAAADADGDDGAGSAAQLDSSARESNVQYLIDSLETFFEESMGKNFDLAFLDLRQLCADDSDGAGDSERQSQLVSLLELVLLCAINSAGKEEVIGAIMNMSDAEQQTLMMLIHNIMARADKEQRGGAGGGIGSSRRASSSRGRSD